ncbi:MAG: hypothetical protein SGILL_010287 [Bacillariaceae sp.]
MDESKATIPLEEPLPIQTEPSYEKTSDSETDDDPQKGTCVCSFSLWTCCGAPIWVRRWITVALVVVVVLIVIFLIAASASTKQYQATVPSVGQAQNSASSLNNNENIVIVGAGAAGLFAGYTLKYLGIDSFQILEAGDDFGGRVRQLDSEDFVDVPLDLGAEWIHVQPSILEQLLLPFENQTWTELPKTIRYQPQTIGVSTDGESVSSRDWFRWFYAETKFYDSTWWSYLADYVVNPYLHDKIQLNTAVEYIDYTNVNNGDKIRLVTTEGEEILADRVIMAVPVKILQDEVITFVPPVPQSKRGAWDSVYVAEGLKVWLEFAEDFYPDLLIPGTIFGTYVNEDRIYFDALFGKDDLTNRHVLALFEVGPTAGAKVTMSDDEIVQTILKELDAMYQGKPSQYLLQSKVQNWSKEPFIQGAYSYNWQEYRNQFGALREPIDKRLYFCGEYLADESATVHGAAISGRNVVRQLLDDLGDP